MIPLADFNRSHAHHLVTKRSSEVSPAIVNRNLAVLKNLLTFALDKGLIENHPLNKFRMLKEEKLALRVMSLEEERLLVAKVGEVDPVVGVYVAILGETGLRKAEGLRLKWGHIDFGQRMVTVEHSKSKRPRYVPLSGHAIEQLQTLIRYIEVPYVFVNPSTGLRLRDPRGPFEKGKKAAGLDWVKGFHGLRYFRATQWVKNGVDLKTVQELLGHSSITTTMRYAHYAPSHASRSILESERIERAELDQSGEKRAKG